MKNLVRGVAIVGGMLATLWTIFEPTAAASMIIARTFGILAVTGMAWVGAGLTPEVVRESEKPRLRLASVVALAVVGAGLIVWSLWLPVRQAAWDRCAARVGSGSPLITDECGGYPQ